MKQDIATQWVEALRSGEFEQGKGALIQDNKHCCLGVLCVLAERADVIQRLPLRGFTLESVRFPDPGEGVRTGALPQVVEEWAGMSSVYGTLTLNGGTAYLTELNDGGKSFAEIADLIEGHIAEL